MYYIMAHVNTLYLATRLNISEIICYRNRPNKEIMAPDWLITSHVTRKRVLIGCLLVVPDLSQKGILRIFIDLGLVLDILRSVSVSVCEWLVQHHIWSCEITILPNMVM